MNGIYLLFIFFFIRIGQESLMEDNWPDEDIENELSPIAVQLGYVQQVGVLISLLFILCKFHLFQESVILINH